MLTLYVWLIAAIVILFAILTLHTIVRTALYRARHHPRSHLAADREKETTT